MKTTRILALPAIAAASLLALTGCFQLPPVGGTTTTEAPGGGTTTEEPAGGASAEDLAGTSWTGAVDGVVDPLGFTLNADGSVDITQWGNTDQTYDFPQDQWSGDSSNLEVTITGLEEGAFDLTVSGTAEGGQMNLTGEGTDGNSYTLSATQG